MRKDKNRIVIKEIHLPDSLPVATDVIKYPPTLESKNKTLDVKQDTLSRLSLEIQNARAKFPGNKFMLAALTEEVGEVARALLQNLGKTEVQKEALQVAVVALRIFEEGDASFEDITEKESLK